MSSTIAAIATPKGKGGLGVIRISGPDAIAVAQGIFAAKSGKSLNKMAGYTALYGHVFDEGGDIDEAVALIFRAPKSYTGEDVAELSCHGGEYNLARVLSAAYRAGAVPAAAGEFTKRAFLGGKLSLTEAEAVADIISADGEYSAKLSLAAHRGAIAAEIDRVAQLLTAISGSVAANIDFPEEDLAEMTREEMATSAAEALRSLDALLDSFSVGQQIRSGIPAVIIGAPNVGKSSLMNFLCRRERSIVSDIPGTTRDIVETHINIAGVTLIVADTAGIRDTDNPIEKIGVQKALEKIPESGIIFCVLDGSMPLSDAEAELLLSCPIGRTIMVINKTDLPQLLNVRYILEKYIHIVYISAINGDGFDGIESAVRNLLDLQKLDENAAVLANGRQYSCAARARDGVAELHRALTSGETFDIVGVLLDEALDNLLELTGGKASQAVIDEIFSHFCVGK